VERGGCRHQGILRHFDEAMEPCGDACDVCTGISVEARAAAAHASTRSMARGAGTGGPGRSTRATGGSSGAVRPSASDLNPDDEALFDRLRGLRKELADARGVPAYIVFNDRVLLEMAARRPADREALLEISGVGPAKLERYGEAFLAAVAEG
jgi:ATP-dependent DNA helicase RecQ